ncbi:helix-turn-helix domain-containing protein [Actinoplanes sp. NPDC026619]|uniref:TetR/AcrR family transcriptional regulator n=1 Tax=Actinoplanes sp. NPDC026619 TaxID=3155798 RepID=UPI0033DDDA8C
MPRLTKQQIEDEILETAATLFARHGFKETSIQRVADAVGYSKTGLLHRFPSKEALQAAVIERALADLRVIAAEAGALPVGPARDRIVITGVARLAMERPGAVALLLSGLMSAPDGEALHETGEAVFAAFGVAAPECVAEHDMPRLVRIVGALGALAVTTVAMHDKLTPAALADIVEVSYDALGHERPNN